MAAALPGFQSAADLGPSPSREAELEELCHSQAEQIERLQDLATAPQQPARQPQGAVIRPEEKQAMVQLLSDLGKRVEDLEKLTVKQAREIEELKKARKDAEEDIEQIRLYFPKLIAEDRKRIAALEEGPDLSDNETVQNHITALFDHMEAIGRKQVSFREASRCLKLSKSRVLQFKASIALDDRFVIVHSESHKQKSLIRLRKYFDGNIAVQPPN
jgi:vacuolar-type H+-ATPase subunit I/STV1